MSPRAALPQIQADPASRKWNLWSYIDAEDAAEACRCALEAETTGHEAMIIAAADNLDALEKLPVEELLTRRYARLRGYGAYEAA